MVLVVLNSARACKVIQYPWLVTTLLCFFTALRASPRKYCYNQEHWPLMVLMEILVEIANRTISITRVYVSKYNYQ